MNDNKTSGGHAVPKQKLKVHKAFYLVMLLIPVLFFILLEISLRLLNYGYDTVQWKEVWPGKLMLNSDIAHRYFYSTENVPYSNQEIFDKVKAQNVFRVFVLGESSAAGYPYMPAGAFSDYIKKRLEIRFPESKIEVVNLSMTAINTYAIRDIFPGVLEQKPDLILIYTGHNEYYGALGVGSMEYLGNNPALVNFILSMNKYKTVELIRNIVSSITKIFSDRPGSDKSGTLMSKIAAAQYIPYGSEKYNAGIRQFESNMEDILHMANEKKVPVILGTLACNLKDQKPFMSLKTNGLPAAVSVFMEAKTEISKGNAEKSRVLFEKAKDLDAVRFRAPSEINRLIRTLGKKYSCSVAGVDSLFSALSPGGIPGDNLMTDHLHPTASGYQAIGRLFYEIMVKRGILPNSAASGVDESDLKAVQETVVSRLDSSIAAFRIVALKNDWPFIERKDKKSGRDIFLLHDYIDTLAFRVCFEDQPWEEAHRKAADWYLKHNKFSEFQKQVDILIERFPVIKGYYEFIIDRLLIMQRYDEAYNYLLKYHSIRPCAYSAKWLGIIELSKEKNKNALSHLQESVHYDASDAQALFNLAGAYVNLKDFNKALETINLCLYTDPGFPGAGDLRIQLSEAVKK
ncbi:MAG: GDSL-type esterase/lipase family protein [Syntrophothermus sp.]